MLIYVVRHAWAAEPGDPAWPTDGQRPLTPDGQERFRRVARALVERGFAPRAIATSPLVRCRQTAEILVEALGPQFELSVLAGLAPGSSLQAALAWTCQQAGQDVAWVGHAPDVGLLTAALVGSPRTAIHFAKGATAACSFSGTPQAGTGELRWFVTAKMLGE